jgi:hypothetical protein
MDLTEQEKLLALHRAGNTEAESFDSTDLLTQNLMAQLGRPNPELVREVEQEITASGEELDYAPLASFSSNGRRMEKTSSKPEKDEVLINVLKKMRESLVDVFERSGLNSGIESSLVSLIDSTGSCLNYLGESTEKFEPLRHLSGLQAPNTFKNASKVLETTLNCYKIGEIEDSKISDDGRLIEIIFAGVHKNIHYKAFGEISANSWEGSEAIDYIYTPRSGKMSVKAFEGGKWVDKSDYYDIKWALEEKDLNKEDEEEELEDVIPKELLQDESIKEKKVEEKEELQVEASNNDSDDEEIGDFPIDISS